jgi:hypothetical protein
MTTQLSCSGTSPPLTNAPPLPQIGPDAVKIGGTDANASLRRRAGDVRARFKREHKGIADERHHSLRTG